MTRALEKTYDGIIIGAGHHGLMLGCYLAKAGLRILLVDRRLHYGGGLTTTEATAPGFYHNLHSINHFHISETPWFKDLGLGRARHLHHAALRVRPGASRRHRAGARPRPRGDHRQHGALLQEGRRHLPRLEPHAPRRSRARILIPERYAEPLPQAEREALLSTHRARARFPRRDAAPAARRGATSCSRTSTSSFCSCSRCRCSAPG